MDQGISRGRAWLNAVFVLVVLGVAGWGLSLVADRRFHGRPSFEAVAAFANIAGLKEGDPVRLQGMTAGIIEGIDPPTTPGAAVRVRMKLDLRLRDLIRSDALARIETQGVVGAKAVEITPGRPDSAALAAGGTIQTEDPVELSTLLRDSRESLHRLDKIASTAHEGLEEINAIASTIRKGEGSLGKLIRDEEAYQRLMLLTQSGERVITDLNENLDALKRTWPLSRYFQDRAFFDRERVLYQPGADRKRLVVREDELFEPGRSALTNTGRHKLDEFGAWFVSALRPTSNVVIAAFSNEPADPEIRQVLTQEQAEAVRGYLIEKHKINRINWFTSRKVAAVGFAGSTPRVPGEPGDADQPPRRVEIILFTPKG